MQGRERGIDERNEVRIVTMKADRTRDALTIVGAFAESGESPSRGDVTVGRKGDLSSDLRR